MDGKAFEAWLGAVRMLTAEQRGQGFAALALAEADAAEDVECLGPSAGAVGEQPTVVGLVAGGSDREAFKVNRSQTASAPPVSPSAPVVVAARSRVESTGCPHCGGRRLQRWGRASGLPRYRCGDCRRTFNGLTRTPMARLRKKEVWAEQAKALMTGESLVKAAERCGVADTTAFRWRHRFLSAPALDKPNRLSGIVEADETFIRESFKGKRIGLPRPARKAVERRPNGACLRNRYQFWSPATEPAPPPMRFCPNSAWPRSPRRWVVLSLRPITCAATGARRSSVLPEGRKSPATSCQSPAVRDRKLPICTSTTSTAITAASRNGCVRSTAWPPDTLTITSAGAGLSKPSGPSPGRRFGCAVPSG